MDRWLTNTKCNNKFGPISKNYLVDENTFDFMFDNKWEFIRFIGTNQYIKSTYLIDFQQ